MLMPFSPELRKSSPDAIANRHVHAGRLAAERVRLLLMLLLMVAPLAAQMPVFPGPGDEPSGGTGIDTRMQAKRIAQLNQKRHNAMISDADKLLQLAEELDKDASAGGKNLSQAERMHKAAEIEKLAKQVKDKMVYAVGEPAELSVPFAASRR